jgi:predicted RNase H-like nuclease (RuvC/YqgF family)
MPDSTREPFLDLPEGQNQSPEQLDSQVQRAQEQLLQLKRQQEAIEKQKRELEELSRKQEELERGRSEMIEKLSRSLVVIERETYEAEKRVEQLKSTNLAFADHLDALERISPKSWSNSDLHRELSKALSAVDEARAEYSKSITRINAKSGEEVLDPASPAPYPEYTTVDEGSFGLWLKRGLAFTLPLILFAIIVLLSFLFLRPG